MLMEGILLGNFTLCVYGKAVLYSPDGIAMRTSFTFASSGISPTGFHLYVR